MKRGYWALAMESTEIRLIGVVWVDQDHDGAAHSYADRKDELLGRLKRIEGQVRGIARMIEEDRYCVDVLNQMAAVRAALRQVGLALLEGHARGCMTRAIQSGDGKVAVDEVMDVVARLT